MQAARRSFGGDLHLSFAVDRGKEIRLGNRSPDAANAVRFPAGVRRGRGQQTEAFMGLQTLIDYDGSGAKRLLIGIVGQGPALDALTKILERDDFITAFPRVKVAGWVPLPGAPLNDSAVTVPAVLQNQPLFPDVAALFAARPGVSMALDVSPDARHMDDLRRHAPLNATLASSEAVLRFCAAAEDGKLAIGGGENLRKAQKLFALLVDQVDGDILIVDRNGIILDTNRHVGESRGLTRNQIIGKSCEDLDVSLGLCLTDKVASPYPEAKDTGKKAEITFSEVMPSGRVRYIHSLCFPVADAFGNPSQFLYIRRDVTEQQHLEQRLQQAEKMAAIGELSTYMAHEIRNPVFSIGGFANSLLRNPSLDDAGREKARIIYEESRRLDGILTNILNFARPTEQALAVFDPESVARQTMELMTIGGDERGIIAVVDITPPLPHVEGNPENLKQCLINLVKNSMEAMPEGGTVSLRARRNDGYVQIDVEDTGTGIPPELHDQVFSPFYTTKQRGAGLGLAMTRKVIEEMGGKVILTSHVGKGTCISLMLPVALAVEDNEAAPDGGTTT